MLICIDALQDNGRGGGSSKSVIKTKEVSLFGNFNWPPLRHQLHYCIN